MNRQIYLTSLPLFIHPCHYAPIQMQCNVGGIFLHLFLDRKKVGVERFAMIAQKYSKF